jgi:hypothetical protein
VSTPPAEVSRSGAKGAPKPEDQGGGAMGDGVANACANRMHTGRMTSETRRFAGIRMGARVCPE